MWNWGDDSALAATREATTSHELKQYVKMTDATDEKRQRLLSGGRERRPSDIEDWLFPGWGETQRVSMPPKQRRRKMMTRVAAVSVSGAAAQPDTVVVPAAAHLPTAAAGGATSTGPITVAAPAANGAAATAATGTATPAAAAATPTSSSTIGMTASAPANGAAPASANFNSLNSLGSASGEEVREEEETEEEELKRLDEHKLGEWTATAICGNDILSSCLYTSGLCAAYAGVWAPISLLAIVVMLYFFRSVYGEVGTALPLNGGAYNALLNTTSKQTASIAACLTILSYVATGVVSGTEACYYLSNVWTNLDVYMATIILLCFFAVLNFMGITESAVVATIIFLFHILTMTMLIIAGSIEMGKVGFSVYRDNANAPTQDGVPSSLFYGFSAAALGISGFETSANFIEEQKSGVFPRTLRNMWIGSLIFNPILCFLAIGTVPMTEILAHPEVLLAKLGAQSAGHWLEVWVSMDAFFVLSGAVITSFVGVTGLVKRLAGDRCLPNFLLQTNKWRGTNHWIILGFLGICISMYAILDGQVSNLSDVYTIAFLSVMSLFAIGDMLLKFKRSSIPRTVRSSWPGVIAALLLVWTALIATLIKKPGIISYFMLYFFVTATVFALTFFRNQALKLMLYSMRYVFKDSRFQLRVENFITSQFKELNSKCVIFFASSDKLHVLNKGIMYVRDNEHTQWVRIVHVCKDDAAVPPKFVENVQILNHIYPKIRIDPVIVHGQFGPDCIDFMAEKFSIPKNMMFITCPDNRFPYNLAHMGGVRVVTG